MLHMRELTQQPDWLTVGGSKVESGVEDRAALPAVIEFLKSHPQTLVMQEMIFGHSPRWTAKTGKSQLDYYDDYLLELLRGLEQQQLADHVLLVVLSDHGDRADSFNVENYHVPLLISGPDITPSRTSALYSHNDLQALMEPIRSPLSALTRRVASKSHRGRNKPPPFRNGPAWHLQRRLTRVGRPHPRVQGRSAKTLRSHRPTHRNDPVGVGSGRWISDTF